MSNVQVLLVEDEYDFGFILKQYLEMSDFDVQWFQDPLDVLNKVDEVKHNQIAILDVMMPNMDGFTLAKQLREHAQLPFLFLTAKNQQIDRILGLKLGADDYIAKPCDPEELILRIRNILKRTAVLTVQNEYQIGTYLFLPNQFLLKTSDETFHLTEREVDLLLLLIRYNNQVVTREVILDEVWKTKDYFAGRSMDVFISRIRKYFQKDESIKIQSIRGVGFQISFPI